MFRTVNAIVSRSGKIFSVRDVGRFILISFRSVRLVQFTVQLGKTSVTVVRLPKFRFPPTPINNLLDGRGQLLPWGGGEEPHCIPWAVPGSPGQDFLLAPSLLVPVSVTVEWSHSSVCPGTLHLVSRYSTGNDFQSKLLWVAKPVK